MDIFGIFRTFDCFPTANLFLNGDWENFANKIASMIKRLFEHFRVNVTRNFLTF